MTRDHVIGAENGLPWHIPEEYNGYLARVAGKTVIMGSTTYEAFGQDLTSKHNIVISRNMPEGESYIVCDSLEAAFQKAESLGEDIFIAGGSSIYKQTIDQADMMYLTYIKGNYEGNAYFPEFDESKWKIVNRQDFDQYEIVTYQRE